MYNRFRWKVINEVANKEILMKLPKKRFQFNHMYLYGSAAFIIGFGTILSVLVNFAPVRVPDANIASVNGASTEKPQSEPSTEASQSSESNTAANPSTSGIMPPVTSAPSASGSTEQAPSSPAEQPTAPEAPSEPETPIVEEEPENPLEPILDPIVDPLVDMLTIDSSADS